MALYADQPNTATALARPRDFDPQKLFLGTKKYLLLKIPVQILRMDPDNIPGGPGSRAQALAEADAPRHLAQQITPAGELPNEDAPHDLFSFGYHVGDLIMLFEMVFARVAALCCHAPNPFQNRNIFGSSISEPTMRPNPLGLRRQPDHRAALRRVHVPHQQLRLAAHGHRVGRALLRRPGALADRPRLAHRLTGPPRPTLSLLLIPSGV
jgi:hypothetical protein